MSTIYEGGSATFTIAYTLTATGEAYDPDDVVLTLRHLDTDTTLTPAVENDDVGSYEASSALPHAGWWVYRWSTGGSLPAADEGKFLVQKSRVI